MQQVENTDSRALVVIPTFNEADNIPRLLPAVLSQAQHIDILVVDDGSPDGTADLVRQFQTTSDRVHLLVRSAKMGLGTAYVEGFRFAIRNGYAYVFEMDADFSHDPAEIPSFLREIQHADLVIGSRYTNGVRVLNWPIKRLLLSYFANVYTRFMTGLPVHDATGGFKCFRRKVLESIDLGRIHSNGYAFQIEMSYKAWKKGFHLAEIPIVFHDRRSGQSKMSRNIVYEAIFMLWKLRFQSLTNRL
ncbi:MAG: polyprenol monophosphomannose synthase [Bacteroidetes bacterium]|nr:polyprenol monophosphomannose synthase [Bacteroidota bacterium]